MIGLYTPCIDPKCSRIGLQTPRIGQKHPWIDLKICWVCPKSPNMHLQTSWIGLKHPMIGLRILLIGPKHLKWPQNRLKCPQICYLQILKIYSIKCSCLYHCNDIFSINLFSRALSSHILCWQPMLSHLDPMILHDPMCQDSKSWSSRLAYRLPFMMLRFFFLVGHIFSLSEESWTKE